MTTDGFPAPASEYGYTLHQIEGTVGTETLPVFLDFMAMKAHVLGGSEGEVFYTIDVRYFLETRSVL